MSDAPQEQPFSETHLDDPAYRERLRAKLNCLIAVLEVACAKVKRTLSAPGADRARLERIQQNLESTLATCQKALGALDRRERLPEDLEPRLGALARDDDQLPRVRKLSRRAEFRGQAERARFEGRPAIGPREIGSCDLDELAKRLQS